MIELLTDRHELELTVKKKKFTFVYFDATLKELIEFKRDAENEIDMREWLFNFLDCHFVEGGLFTRNFSRNMFDKIPQWQLTKIMETVMKNWSAGMFGEKKKIKKDNGDFFSGSTADDYPDYALIMRLVEGSNETIDSLLNKSWRTVKYMLNGIVWNIRAETEEGRKKNMTDLAKETAKEKGTDVNQMLKDRLKRLEAKRAKEKLQNNSK